MSAPRILVTGASGFVGSHVLGPLKARGFTVHTIGRRTPRGRFDAHHAADLTDDAAVDAVLAAVRPSHVLHLAWYAEHGRFWSAPENLDWIGTTFTLARLAQRHRVRRFVGIGTCAEYDWSDGGPGYRREDDAIAPATLYGRAKAVTHTALIRFFADERMDFAWGRLFHLFGADEPAGKLVSSTLASLRLGQPVALRAGEAERDYLPVEEAGFALAGLVASNVCGVVNIGSGEAACIRDIAGILASFVGRADLIRGCPADFPAGEPPRMVADASRLRLEVGVRSPPSLSESLKRLYEATSAEQIRRA